MSTTETAKENEDDRLSMIKEVGATFTSTFVNVINCIIGAGILSIPATVHNTGLFGAFFLLLSSLALSLFGSFYLTVAATYTNKDTLGGISSILYGKNMIIITNATLIIYELGVSTAYFVIIFEQVLDLLETWGGLSSAWVWNNRWWITYVTTILFSVPLLSIRKLDMLKYTSGGAVACIILFVIISVYLGIVQLTTEPLHYNYWPKDIGSVTASVAIFSTALCFHTAVPKLHSELKYPKGSKFATKVHKMFRIGAGAAIFSCCLYYIVGIFAYFAFGNSIAGNLLTNFQQKGYWYLSIVKLAYALVALFSNPIVVYPSVVTIDRLLFKSERVLWRRVSESFIWCTIVWSIAIAIPQLDVVFGLTGSTGGILLIYVYPAILYIAVVKRFRKHPRDVVKSILGPSWLYPFAHILVLVSGMLGIISTISQIADLASFLVCAKPNVNNPTKHDRFDPIHELGLHSP